MFTKLRHQLNTGILALVLITWVIGYMFCSIAGYIRANAHMKELVAIMDGLDQKHLFAECVPKPMGAYERRFVSLMKRSGKAMIEKVSDAQEQQRQYREYIEDWVHEIKAPITAAHLMCSNENSAFSGKVDLQLSLIDEGVEKALFYARSNSVESDLVVQKTLLSDAVASAMGKYRRMLLDNGFALDIGDMDMEIYTDGKWVSFMLGQILSNAIRYRCDSPAITMRAKKLGRLAQLEVTDNGLGIPAHELPRIFDRGFTGSNGRKRGGSTGMGLYICKRLAGHLQIDLAVRSVEGEYTTFTFTFPAKENLSEM